MPGNVANTTFYKTTVFTTIFFIMNNQFQLTKLDNGFVETETHLVNTKKK